MKFVLPVCASLAAAVSACAVAPPLQPPPSPPPLLSPQHVQTLALVETNSDAARVLAGLRLRGLVLVPGDISRVEALTGSPGFAWRLGPDHLHIHVYRDAVSAAAGTQRFIATVVTRSQIIDWVGKPYLFRCGTAVALYLGETPQALTILTNLCGPPVWRRD